MIRNGDPIFLTHDQADALGLAGDADGDLGYVGFVLATRRHPRDDRLLCQVAIGGALHWLPADQLELALLAESRAPIRLQAEPAESLDDLNRPLNWE